MHEKKILDQFKLFEQKLENKLTHIHIQPRDPNHFFIGIYIKTGSRFESPEEAGISHFLEHMLFRGSKKNPSFLGLAEKFERFGGEWNAATGHEHTEYTYMGLSESALPLIELFAEVIHSPLLLDPQKEKEIILREIEDEMNEFGEFLDLDFHSSALAWKDSGFSFPITGTEASVKKLDSEHLKKYFGAHYKPENIVVCTWGGSQPSGVLKTVRSCFNFPSKNLTSSFPSFTSVPLEKRSPSFKFVPNTDNQYQVQLSFSCEGEWSEKTPVYTLLCHLLSNGFSSRLSKHLREELGLVYSISAHLSSFLDRGLVSLSYATTKGQFEVALEELLKVLSVLKKEGIREDELERAKNQELLELVSLAHNPEGYSFFLARNKHWNQKMGLAEAITEIKKVTKETLDEEIKTLFKGTRSFLVVMGNKERSFERKSLKLIDEYLK